ncbi:hypothetical protein A3I46_01810 [Candidatus Kaiserbacteria bacterium RIFCSPLOWO2_02_FULL_54_13]|nr:MAG: hypothetical protein A3I46_01810 [Candidatus Kaiserbacteria bacterium RIFCSPLOWO2_02_FULL_54_13]OGG90211.1 MAG: hypothetical protein A3G12_01030 [Candidatus Kaiserbacteria bacterium RIFCSPLOWO2_12_FULL_54_10]
MSRFAPYLGIVAALLLGVFVVIFFDELTALNSPASPSAAVSDISPIFVGPSASPPPAALPQQSPIKNAASAAVMPAPQREVPTPAPVAATTTSPSESAALLGASALTLRAALVNIICYAPVGSNAHSILGSGVFIDPKGVILTNAHIAKYFLLADRNVSCTIRAGGPATDTYKAALIYISPMWLQANADVLSQTLPKGTGEYDFALLAVTGSTTAEPLPSSFPSIPLATNPPLSSVPVIIASYGAQSLEPDQIRSALFPTIVLGSVKDVLTFAVNTVDVLALGGSAAAQEGSSGGGVSDASGELVGTITTSTIQGDANSRSLNAITASYIRAAYASETGQALDLLLARPTADSISDFAPQLSALEKIITANLP